MIRGNRGQALMLTGVMLVALVGFAALGIDVAYMYSVRHELQRCADSGALAGASIFTDNVAIPDPAVAEALARDYARRDVVATAPLTDLEVQVTVTPADNQVRVDTQHTVNLFFARIFGQGARSIAASATAEGRAIPAGPSNPARKIVRLVL